MKNKKTQSKALTLYYIDINSHQRIHKVRSQFLHILRIHQMLDNIILVNILTLKYF